MDYTFLSSTLDTKQRVSPKGTDYWMARDLQVILGYEEWRKFGRVIERAVAACRNSTEDPKNHFVRTAKKVSIGSGAMRDKEDWFLTRYACYLLAMNGDSNKPEIALAQTYFAVQTRRHEVTELERRLDLRERMKKANKTLSGVAQSAGVQRFGVFHDAGYKGLYGGFGQSDIKSLKGISTKEDVLDRMGSTELAANYFRVTQAEDKLLRDSVQGEEAAILTHKQVGEEVRATIRKIGGTMPEKLPSAPSIRKLAAEKKRKQRQAAPRRIKGSSDS